MSNELESDSAMVTNLESFGVDAVRPNLKTNKKTHAMAIRLCVVVAAIGELISIAQLLVGRRHEHSRPQSQALKVWELDSFLKTVLIE